MTQNYVIGVDPGDSTGLFVARDGVRFAAFQGTPLESLAELGALLRQVRADGDRAYGACERFVSTGRPGRTHQTTPLELIGLVRVAFAAQGYSLVLQAPVDAKRLAPNDVLRRLGWYVTARDVGRPDAHDVNDAARHALLLLVTRFAGVYERLLDAQP